MLDGLFMFRESKKNLNKTLGGFLFREFSLPSPKKNKRMQGRTLLAPVGLKCTFFVVSPHGPEKV